MQIKLDLHIETVNASQKEFSKLPYEYAKAHIDIITQQATPQVQAGQATAESDEVIAAGLSD
jgi:hypothetical protein